MCHNMCLYDPFHDSQSLHDGRSALLSHGGIQQVDGLGDSDEADSQLPVDGSFKCIRCGIEVASLKSLKRHMYKSCPQLPGLDPIELEFRRTALRRSNKTLNNTNGDSEFENSVVYEVDKEIEKYISSCSDNYAKFKLCEKNKPPLAVQNFWPILLDYRRNETLKPLHGVVCYKNGFEVLYSILLDAYNFHGITTIDIKKNASVWKDDTLYRISTYRKPASHLQVHKNPRPDRPFFSVDTDQDLIKISLHPEFLCILPQPFVNFDETEDSIPSSQDSIDLDDSIISEMFSQVILNVGEEMYPLSQQLSQVSLDDENSIISYILKTDG